MLLDIVLLVIGLALLIKGADWFVNSASALARKYNISDLAIGLTIVAFGTSSPELVVNSMASIDGHSEIVLGNVIGSSNFNLFIILGIAGLIHPLIVASNTVFREIPLLIVSIALLYFLCNPIIYSIPILSRFDAVILMLFFLLFLLMVYRQVKKDPVQPQMEIMDFSKQKIIIFIILGLAGLIYGGKITVDHAVEIATELGWSEKTIGLTILAVGTSLPELATTVIAAIKGNNNIAVGNVIGSNIFNLLFILSVSAFIHPVTYHTSFNLDLIILISGATLLFLLLLVSKQRRMGKWAAFVFLITYLVYTIYLIL